MSDIQKKIRDLTVKVIEEYTKGQSANLTIKGLILSGLIENKEILKRVCENFNINVYMSLFKSPNTNKYNIVFEKADYDELKVIFDKRNEKMDDYSVLPVNYKETIKESMQKEYSEKIASEKINNTIPPYDGYQKFQLEGKLKSLDLFIKYSEREKLASLKRLKDICNDIDRSTREALFAGDSITDLTKIAGRYIQELGLDEKPVTSIMIMIAKKASDEGYAINTDLTKLSSMKISKENKDLLLFKKYITEFDSVRTYDNMIKKANEVLFFLDGFIKAYEKFSVK